MSASKLCQRISGFMGTGNPSPADRLTRLSPSQEGQQSVHKEQDRDDNRQAMEDGFNAAPGAETAALAPAAEETAEVLPLGLQEDKRGQGHSEDNLDNAQIGRPGL